MNRPLDTSEDARRREIEAIRSMTRPERLRVADSMSAEVRALAEAGIRRRRPGASADEVADELAALMLGRELANAAKRARLSRVG